MASNGYFCNYFAIFKNILTLKLKKLWTFEGSRKCFYKKNVYIKSGTSIKIILQVPFSRNCLSESFKFFDIKLFLDSFPHNNTSYHIIEWFTFDFSRLLCNKFVNVLFQFPSFPWNASLRGDIHTQIATLSVKWTLNFLTPTPPLLTSIRGNQKLIEKNYYYYISNRSS